MIPRMYRQGSGPWCGQHVVHGGSSLSITLGQGWADGKALLSH